ncbi:MAG TPA: hypothetical protein VF733_01720 [Candidatus Saccharimonadales bacterium]
MYSSRNAKKIPKKRPRKPLVIILIILVVLTLGVGVYLYMNRNKAMSTGSTKTSSSQSSNDQKQPEGPKETSEGQTFPVPENLPKDSVKNYVLVTENDEFKIRRLEGSNKYTITLYAIINNPSQYDMYRDQLKEYKQKALDYLKNKGIDVNSLEITYEPDEAKNL